MGETISVRTPVLTTSKELDQGAKRHRSDSNWVYKRKSSNAQQQRNAAPSEDVRPVIHLSQPEAKEPPSTKPEVPITKPEERREIDSKKPPPSPSKEPRRFHVSRAMLAAASKPPSGSIFKKDRYGPTLFVERTRREKLAPKPRKSLLVHQQLEQELAESNTAENAGIQQKDLKRPGIAKKARQMSREVGEEETKRNPLPPSFTNRQDENMDKIAQDMNDWVLAEVGANIESMNVDKKKAETHRFKPKAPAKRYQERHPEVVPSAVPADTEGDVNMMDGSEEEGDDEDWIIEEYIRIPANAVTMDVNPSEMGFLMLEGEEESLLFFGPQNDDEDEWAEDEEDENGMSCLCLACKGEFFFFLFFFF